MRSGSGVMLAAALATSFAVRAAAAQGRTAQVSFLEGRAQRQREGAKPSDLKTGSPLAQGDLVSTSEGARLEIRFSDASVLRLGPKAKLQLTTAHFGGGAAKRKLSARLFFGQIWAKVTSVIQGEQKFQIETENAVAGVRGTEFRVDAPSDKSVLVRVYEGEVAVGKNTGSPGPVPGGRREVPGPQEVSREQWEKIVGRQTQIVIAADGTPGDPQPFTEEDEKGDAWAQWNRQRDAAAR